MRSRKHGQRTALAGREALQRNGQYTKPQARPTPSGPCSCRRALRRHPTQVHANCPDQAQAARFAILRIANSVPQGPASGADHAQAQRGAFALAQKPAPSALSGREDLCLLYLHMQEPQWKKTKICLQFQQVEGQVVTAPKNFAPTKRHQAHAKKKALAYPTGMARTRAKVLLRQPGPRTIHLHEGGRD